ncbi:hypothetical protein ACFQVC_08945 [Streptomyces monticola]|uniref:DUF624 domain-containing protein n=1 Tax=Streptomyces monticola TaxID=2666263 RepID=A0ABW2JF76_9ACTN
MTYATRRETPYGERFTLFAEVLWIGLLVTLGSLPLVTWPAAMAAGCAAVRRTQPDGPGPGTARRFAADWRAALRGGTLRGAAGLGALAFLAADLRLAAVAGDLPGFGLLVAVCALAATAVVVVQLRAAAAWSRSDAGGRWTRTALHRTRTDPAGTAMLGAAVAAAAVCAWQSLLLAPLVPGLLALAAVAVEGRRRAGAEDGRCGAVAGPPQPTPVTERGSS